MSNPLLMRRRAMMVGGNRPDYFGFIAQEDNCTVQIDKVGSPTDRPMEYALNKGTFSPYAYGTAISLNNGDCCEFRRPEDTTVIGFSTNYDNYYRLITSGVIRGKGNITSLLTSYKESVVSIPTCSFCYFAHSDYNENLYCDLIIQDGITEISGIQWNHCVFAGCSGLRGKLVLPDSLTKIGHSAFSGCANLSGQINLPSNLSYIGEASFANCSSFTGDIIIPLSLTELNSSYNSPLFGGCSGIKGKIVLHENVTSIGAFCFFNTQASFVKVLATTPPTCGQAPFPSYKPIYVPYSTDHSILDAYKAANVWSSYANKIFELDENGEVPS